MIAGFNRQFESVLPIVGDGSKQHTIREDKHRRWRPGLIIHMAFGVRTKNYNCFCDKYTCKSIQEIKIVYHLTGYPMAPVIEIFIGGKLFYRSDGFGRSNIKKLAKNDGFDSVDDFFKWFDKDFSGVIVHWTDLRY